MGFLYLLTSPSGKGYIGITNKTVARRVRQHGYNAAKRRYTARGDECPGLYNAIRKYGLRNFKIKTLVEAEWGYLQELECRAIDAYGTFWPNGYNLTAGGEGTVGTVISEKTRKRKSEQMRRRLADPTKRAELATYLKLAVEKAARRWDGRPDEKAAWWAEHARKMAEGRKRPEAIARQKLALKEAWKTNSKFREDNARRMSARMKGQPKTAEFKQQMAARRKAEWADPEMRAKRLAGYAEYQKRRKAERGS